MEKGNSLSSETEEVDFIQRASHGLQEYYILWIDGNPMNNEIAIQDLVRAGFQIRPFKSILEAEEYMEKHKNKFNKNYQFIVISSGKMCKTVVEHILENSSGKYTKMIVYTS